MILQHLINPRISVQLVRREGVFQNIQIFSPCLTGLRLAYQTSNEKCDFPSSLDV